MHAQILFYVRFFVSGGKRFWNSRSIGNCEQGKVDLLEGTGTLEVDRAEPYGVLNSMHVIQPKCYSIINRFSFA